MPVRLSAYLPVCLCVYLFARLPICVSVSFCLYVYLPACPCIVLSRDSTYLFTFILPNSGFQSSRDSLDRPRAKIVVLLKQLTEILIGPIEFRLSDRRADGDLQITSSCR